MVESTASIPGCSLIPMHGDAASILDHSCHVKQIPGHERRVALSKIVLRPAGSWVKIRGAWPLFTNPTRVCLWWDDIAQVL